jgi:hypothetical protein
VRDPLVPEAHSDPVRVPAGAAPRRRLRVGLLLDGTRGQRWVAQALRRITEDETADIALVVLNEAPEGEVREVARASRMQRWIRNRKVLAYALFERYDRRRYHTPEHPQLEVDLAPLLAGVPVLRVRPRMTRFHDELEEQDLARIREHDLDVLLRFGFRILRGGVLQAARHGVWSLHHGDNAVNRGGPPGFWEVLTRQPVTGAVLQRLSEELDAGEVLGRSYSSTNPFSPTGNRANYYLQASELLVAGLRRLADDRRIERMNEGAGAPWSAYAERLYTRPSTREMLSLWAGLLARLVASKLRTLLTREQWLIAYRCARAGATWSDVPDGTFYRFRELQPPADRYWADPFPVRAGDRRFLFFEEHFYAHADAHIAVCEFDAEGRPGAPQVALRRPYHLSYPSVFEWEGEWYMTPETANRGAVELYRARAFPLEWEHVGNLLSGVPAVDPTICLIDGRWWMFVGVQVGGAAEATGLHLYSAPTPLGPWRPHRRNPLKIDVRGARPGGRVFQHEGAYYRVGQDGAPTYGTGLRVYRIERLDDDAFVETEVAAIRPRWRRGLVGMHTLNAAGGLTAIDVRQRRRRFF